MRTFFFLVAVFLFSWQPLRAETIVLTDGSVYEGLFASPVDSGIIVVTAGDTVFIAADRLLVAPSRALPDGPASVLSPDFGPSALAATTDLIRNVSGERVAEVFEGLPVGERGSFLAQFWAHHSPLLLRYYYGFHLGRHYVTISDAFFESGDLIPARYRTGFPKPHAGAVAQAAGYAAQLLAALPRDATALCAAGFLDLESGEFEAAERRFRQALKFDRRRIEARYGRALAILGQHHRKHQALRMLQDTVAMDRTFEGALYALGMCHIAMVGMDRVDLDHYFGLIVERFPDHYDAHYKLGCFYESLHDYDRAAAAYSRQLAVNPGHAMASRRMANVALVLRTRGKPAFTRDALVDLARTHPMEYLPLLAEACIGERDWASAQDAYNRFLDLLRPSERLVYESLDLLASTEVLAEIGAAYTASERARLLRKFWVLADPTPTTPVNERHLEHLRRTHYARTHFSGGLHAGDGRPWDDRGDVYVRFGPPDHRSWSDFLVFETDPAVARVKNRLNSTAFEVLDEITGAPRSNNRAIGLAVQPAPAEIRGIPTFPLPRRNSALPQGDTTGPRWESWIYAHVGGGFEIAFLDAFENGDYRFAHPPAQSRNFSLWVQLAPETIVGGIVRKTPSVYHHPYEGTPLTLYVSTARFRGPERRTRLEVYLGVPAAEISEVPGESGQGIVERSLTVISAGSWKPVYATVDTLVVPATGSAEPGALLIDQVATDLPDGRYFVAAQMRDVSGGGLQIHKQEVDLTDFQAPRLSLSDIEVAGRISEVVDGAGGRFTKGDLEVVPLPSRTFLAGQPVGVYCEVYHLRRDAFGRTHYRVDYETDRLPTGFRLRSLLGRRVGDARGGSTARVSYEHEGETETDALYVLLDVPGAGSEPMRLTIRVTDLLDPERPAATQTADFAFGE